MIPFFIKLSEKHILGTGTGKMAVEYKTLYVVTKGLKILYVAQVY